MDVYVAFILELTQLVNALNAGSEFAKVRLCIRMSLHFSIK